MNPLRRKLFLLALLGFVTLGATLYVDRPLAAASYAWDALPLRLGAWEGEDVPVADPALGGFESEETFGRRYRKGAEAGLGESGLAEEADDFLLTVVHFPKGKVNLPRPENGLRPPGARLAQRRPLSLEGGWPKTAGTYFQIRDPSGRVSHHAYAFCTPKETFGDYLEFRQGLARQALQEGRPASALVRFSMTEPADGRDPEGRLAEARLKRLWKEFAPSLQQGFEKGHDRPSWLKASGMIHPKP